jgi:hypothetical protein
VGTGIKSQLFHTITGAVEQRLVSPPVSGDFKGGTSVTIPATQVIAAGISAQLASCVIVDDEGNSFPDAFDFVEWTTADPAKATVDERGVVTKIGAANVVITATALGQTDTCTISVT